MAQPLQNTVWQFLMKVNTHLSYDPVILHLCVYPEK